MRPVAPAKWDMECDVAVVGWGAAGTAAAVAAHMEGAQALILEKMPEGGGNTRVSGGNIIIPSDRKFIDYLETLSFRTVGRDILEVFVDNAMKNGDWIKEMGGEIQVFMPLEVAYPNISPGASFPQIEGAETVVKYNIKGTAEEGKPSQRLWKFLSGLVAKKGIKCSTSTAVKELITDASGQVIGVKAEKDGGIIYVKARRGVVLACGGYENDPEMKWDYLPAKPVMFLGTPGNTGDGIKMAQKVGADLWHMTRLACAAGFQAPGFDSAFPINFLNEGFIFVDKYGRRFINEAGIETHEYYRALSEFDVEKVEFPRVPMWAIFDEQTRRNGPVSRGTAGYNRDLYTWSLDNAVEVSKGWILQGKAAAELAEKMRLPPETLEQTINNYNDDCAAGKDTAFGRAREESAGLKAAVIRHATVAGADQYPGRTAPRQRSPGARSRWAADPKVICGWGAWLDLGLSVSGGLQCRRSPGFWQDRRPKCRRRETVVMKAQAPIEIASRNFEVDAPQLRVWRLIGKVIFNCLPGMEEIDIADETHFRAVQRTKVGFLEVKMRLEGELTDVAPPRSLAVNLSVIGLWGFIKMRQKVTIGMTAVGAAKTAVQCQAAATAVSGLPGGLLLSQARPFVQAMFEAMEKRMQYLVSG